MKKLFLLIQIVTLFSCSPRIRTFVETEKQALNKDTEVYVIALNDSFNIEGKSLGRLEIGETGFTSKCDYDNLIFSAKCKARSLGANVVKVTDHKFPDGMRSSCHKINVQLYFVNNTENLEKNKLENQPKKEDWDYALLHVYRTSGYGKDLKFDLLLDDEKLHTITESFKTRIRIKKEGLQKISAQVKNYKTDLNIDFKQGQEYYLECKIALDPIIGTPTLVLKDHQTGKQVFENFIAKNTY